MSKVAANADSFIGDGQNVTPPTMSALYAEQLGFGRASRALMYAQQDLSQLGTLHDYSTLVEDLTEVDFCEVSK